MDGRRLFTRAAAPRSAHPRATAHAAVAAAEFLAAYPDSRAARDLLVDAARTLAPFLAPRRPPASSAPAGSGPHRRLTYANALIPEALVAIGAALGEADILARGLRLLSWLVDEETVAGRFSFAPTGGRGPGDARPAFDQQPIEASSFAEAFARAFDVTGDPAWLAGLARAAAWFHGDNDSGAPLVDAVTGGGFDGLDAGGRESQRGRRVDDRRHHHAAAGAPPAARLSAGGVEGRQQLTLRDHRGPHGAVGGAVGEVDRAVVALMRPLHEHHVVDVALALPRQLGLQQRLVEPRQTCAPSSRPATPRSRCTRRPRGARGRTG